MNIYHLFNNEGKYLMTNLFEEKPLNSTEVKPEVPIEYAVFNGTVWYDNREQSTIDLEKYNTYLKLISNSFTELSKKTLAFSIGKDYSLGYEYIKEQADRYKYKYQISKGEIIDTLAVQMIADESSDFGITPEQMNAMIIQRFEAGQTAYINACSIFERARTKALTFAENANFIKAQECLDLMNNFNDWTELGLGTFVNQLLAI